MRFEAQFFDGQTAATRTVSVTVGAASLEFSSAEPADSRSWPFAQLRPVERPRTGASLRLTSDREPGARLIVPAGPAADALLARVPHLSGGINPARALRVGLIVVACVAVIGALGYGILNFAPQRVAEVMPDGWRERLGEQTEKSFVKDSRQCQTPQGSEALAALSARLVQGLAEAPKFTVRVFDLPMINAFALPGGRIVVTGRLIKAADTPEEVAGVLAHELGHVVNRHPEAQLVRVLGLQALIGIASGGTGGDTLTSLAALVTVLRYTRSAEREADAFAQSSMELTGIDPMGLKRFFERVQKLEGKGGGPFAGFGDILSTHPGTDERISGMRPLPEGRARPVLDAETWQKLKGICG